MFIACTYNVRPPNGCTSIYRQTLYTAKNWKNKRRRYNEGELYLNLYVLQYQFHGQTLPTCIMKIDRAAKFNFESMFQQERNLGPFAKYKNKKVIPKWRSALLAPQKDVFGNLNSPGGNKVQNGYF